MPWTSAAHEASRRPVTVKCAWCQKDCAATNNRTGLNNYHDECYRLKRIQDSKIYRKNKSEEARQKEKERLRRYRRARAQAEGVRPAPQNRPAYTVVSDPGPFPLVAGLGIADIRQGITAMLDDGCFNAGTVLEFCGRCYVVAGAAGTEQTLEAV